MHKQAILCTLCIKSKEIDKNFSMFSKQLSSKSVTVQLERERDSTQCIICSASCVPKNINTKEVT